MEEVDKRILDKLLRALPVAYFPRLLYRLRWAYEEANERTHNDPVMDQVAASYAWGHDRHALVGQAFAMAAADCGLEVETDTNEPGNHVFRLLRTQGIELLEAAVPTPNDLPQEAKFRKRRASNWDIDPLLYLPTLEPPGYRARRDLFGIVLHGPLTENGERVFNELGFCYVGFPDQEMSRYVCQSIDLIPVAEQMESKMHRQEQAEQQDAAINPVLRKKKEQESE